MKIRSVLGTLQDASGRTKLRLQKQAHLYDGSYLSPELTNVATCSHPPASLREAFGFREREADQVYSKSFH